MHLICGSFDAVVPEIPFITDAEPVTFKLINSEAKILKQILTS